MILRSTVELDLRYAAQYRHHLACTPKSLTFGPTSFLLVHVPGTFSYARTVHEALPLTIADPRLRFTILRTRLSIASELPCHTTLVSRLRNCISNVLQKTTLCETRFDETFEEIRFTLDLRLAHTYPITTPVLDPTSDTNANRNISDTLPILVRTSPMRLSFSSETMTLHWERNAANDGESTAVHDADELRSVILNNPETPGILLCAHDDLRGRISTSREAIMNELSELVVNDLTKRLATINARNNDELAMLRTRIIQLEIRLCFTTQSASTPPHGPFVVESIHTNTAHDHGRSPLPAAPYNEHVPTPPITSNPFTFDALAHVETQTNRGPQYVPSTFPHGFPINDPTNVPGLEAKRTLLSPFN